MVNENDKRRKRNGKSWKLASATEREKTPTKSTWCFAQKTPSSSLSSSFAAAQHRFRSSLWCEKWLQNYSNPLHRHPSLARRRVVRLCVVKVFFNILRTTFNKNFNCWLLTILSDERYYWGGKLSGNFKRNFKIDNYGITIPWPKTKTSQIPSIWHVTFQNSTHIRNVQTIWSQFNDEVKNQFLTVPYMPHRIPHIACNFKSKSRKVHFSCPLEWKLITAWKCEIKNSKSEPYLSHRTAMKWMFQFSIKNQFLTIHRAERSNSTHSCHTCLFKLPKKKTP